MTPDIAAFVDASVVFARLRRLSMVGVKADLFKGIVIGSQRGHPVPLIVIKCIRSPIVTPDGFLGTSWVDPDVPF